MGDSGGWLVVTFVPVPSEGMKIWRGKSNPRPFEGVSFSSIPVKFFLGGPVGSNLMFRRPCVSSFSS